MKYAFLMALTLTGCLTSPKPKTVHRDYSVGPECLREDSATTIFTDTAEIETRNMSCTVGEPRPSSP